MAKLKKLTGPAKQYRSGLLQAQADLAEALNQNKVAQEYIRLLENDVKFLKEQPIIGECDMSALKQTNVNSENQNFDLVRLSKSKEAVDLVPNTIRAFAKQGLRLYRHGKMVFFSRTELAAFIKANAD